MSNKKKSIEFTGNASDFLKIGVASAARGDLDAVKTILQSKPNWLSQVGSHRRTMLWEAAYRGRLAVVKHLFEQGADVEARGCHYTPLLVEISPHCAAAHKKHHDVAEFLIDIGATYDVYSAIFLGDTDEVT